MFCVAHIPTLFHFMVFFISYKPNHLENPRLVFHTFRKTFFWVIKMLSLSLDDKSTHDQQITVDSLSSIDTGVAPNKYSFSSLISCVSSEMLDMHEAYLLSPTNAPILHSQPLPSVKNIQPLAYWMNQKEIMDKKISKQKSLTVNTP